MQTFFKSVFAVIGAIVLILLGGWSPLLQVLVVFIAFDYILGVLVAASYGQLNSKIGFKGIAKKVIILALVAVAYSIDTITGDGTFIRDAVIFFYMANELLSILETVGKTNLPIPDVLRKAVETLNGKSKSKE
ncbi:holin family protein [Pseudogracilibacillus auburnensis]|uniref:Toxin secretion/phage lysis holin n=1 Tax=Pseudogracilibacillus auburnensis TaxID=1494959 RepID=A0A2V3W0T9_9BACI|nr:phage holin family protein [Pseudogracilibacillus auburnensis]PXW86698.1 toxin secretion/phage lysis holin [Pseudogracilibacillus auburnensis]